MAEAESLSLISALNINAVDSIYFRGVVTETPATHNSVIVGLFKSREAKRRHYYEL